MLWSNEVDFTKLYILYLYICDVFTQKKIVNRIIVEKYKDSTLNIM